MALLETAGDYEFARRLTKNLGDIADSLSKLAETHPSEDRIPCTPLSMAVAMVEDWYDGVTDDFLITRVDYHDIGEYKFILMDHLGTEEWSVYVRNNRLYNDEGTELVEDFKNLEKSSLRSFINRFEMKWYKN